MTRSTARHSWLLAARFRAATACLAILSCVALSTRPAQADPIHGEATLATANGYARLVLRLDEDVDSDVSVAGSVLIIRFKRPVDVPVDQLSDAVPDYVGSARRDPDGSAIRLALSRKVTVNAMVAGERLFVDLLPDGWKGMPPGLPPEIVRELSDRARAAERALRQQRAASEKPPLPPVRVRASVQPTFVRYVFEVPGNAGISSSLGPRRFSVAFDKPLTFDLTDAKLAAPATVGAIDQKVEGDTALVDFTLIGDVNVRAFRETNSYVVDVGFQPTEPPPLLPPTPPRAQAGTDRPAAVEAAAPSPVEKPREMATPAAPNGERTGEASRAAPKPDAPPAEAAAAAPPPVVPPADSAAPPPLSIARSSDGTRLSFSFPAPAPAALFRRADTVWLVLDSHQAIDLDAIRRDAQSLVSDVSRVDLPDGQAIRMRLQRPQMISLAGAGTAGPGRQWELTFADALKTSPQPLVIRRNVADPKRAALGVALTGAGKLHRLIDPDAGDTLLVVTALPPEQGVIRRRDFIELSVLPSAQGIVVRPNADDVSAEVGADSVTFSRPGGLTLSSAAMAPERAEPAAPQLFDDRTWRDDRAAAFIQRRDDLIERVASASDAGKTASRLALARFYMAWGLYAEAKGVLDLSLADAKPGTEDPATLQVYAVASSLIGRPDQALKALALPAVGGANVQLWKALAYARQHKWASAREAFKNAEWAITTLPQELQRMVQRDALRASLEVKDYDGASARLDDLQAIGITEELRPAIAVLRGRLAEGLGRDAAALSDYRSAVASHDRAAAAEAKLLEIGLRQRRGDIAADEALRELETLSVIWRGDGIEVRTLQRLARLYADAGRYAESLAAAKMATRLEPDSPAARLAQDEAAALFAQLFLENKGQELSPVDALAIFYDYRELTPIGRRGDEMIRRLADRLIAVDLLTQAAELLQYQIDHRLEGAARAQVAARLAMVYLMNHKPDRALAALHATRIADLAGELRLQRLLLEARAQSDIGRRDLALEIVANMTGREAVRLRSDIYWAGRRWREAAEQIELYYGERWRDFRPLNAVEKGDILRAAIGYALAEDALGLARFREKYAPLMAAEADRAAFEMASHPASADNADLANLARMAGSVDTLDSFLREMQARFPDVMAKAALPPASPSPDTAPTGALPAIVGTTRVSAAD